MNTLSKNFETCTLSITNNNKITILDGLLKDPLRSKLLSNKTQVYVQYWAAAPPDYRHCISGSGLPYPNEDVAFESSPNIGKHPLGKDGSFSIKLKYPNSYYKNIGSIYVKPSVKVLFIDEQGTMYGKIISIVLGEGIPNRSLQ